jgi:hypothetical protein
MLEAKTIAATETAILQTVLKDGPILIEGIGVRAYPEQKT